MGSIEIKSVAKLFGSARIIKNIDISIGEGEFVVLVGPSGCGKSTLLRMIAGLEDVSEGRIEIGGRVVNDLPPQKRDVAMVFQNYALYPHYTVYQNMAFGLKLRRTPKDEIDKRVGHAAQILGLEELLQRYPKSLSGGQRQRVAMGRAIVRDPVVYLFDEPLSNLDAKLRISMRTEIKSLHQSLKRTTVYVTHDQVEAMTMADRIVIMRDGVIEQIGTPMELYNAPANRFVAGFIGAPTMNFFDGVIERSGAGAVVRLPGEVRLPVSEALESGRDVVLGVRPEHWALSDKGSPLAGRVRLIEPTGPSDYLTIDTPAGAVTAVSASGQARAAADVTLDIAPGNLHLFDRQSGQRIAA